MNNKKVQITVPEKDISSTVQELLNVELEKSLDSLHEKTALFKQVSRKHIL